ncbi:MAG: hypothetical protein GY749_36920 [Desulfobacteraceae bacterium]|nr:hypothetical protein [Desulfobacteraceae bacterium]
MRKSDSLIFRTPFHPVLVPMLRVGMQGVALRADIRRAKLVGKSLSPNLWIRPLTYE